ncbi:hypothetical protein CYMTET_11464 [Cymbomonas tetramitiformis]|uniref:Helicase/UvrB N-terminal domain-containing protein n=1 Tax=Cymbomonas tetramitiformis TaxID=36881 RepID=A0AAE0GMI3_9CHLO|nr:hypothetical protein CYMTET_11464 [Cymbomonas tetramitiformis]
MTILFELNMKEARSNLEAADVYGDGIKSEISRKATLQNCRVGSTFESGQCKVVSSKATSDFTRYKARLKSFLHEERSTKRLYRDTFKCNHKFKTGVRILELRHTFRNYLKAVVESDFVMGQILSTRDASGCSACSFIRNIDDDVNDEQHGETPIRTIDFFQRRSDMPLPWQRFASQYTLDVADDMRENYGHVKEHNLHTFFVQHLMGSGKSDVVFNILRLLTNSHHRVFMTSEKDQIDFLDTFKGMINLRASGNYKAPNAKHIGADNKLRQNRQGSDPTFMVDESYARLTIASADEEVQASLDKFFTQASAKVEDRTDDLPDRRWETLVFVFDEAHMFATSAKKMKHLTDMITKLVKMENRMNAIFVMLSGTLFTETSLCKSWKEYRTVVDALPNSKHEFAVSYLNELPVTLRPTYTFKYLGPPSVNWPAFLSFGATVQAPDGVDQITATHTKTDPVDRMKACLQNLKWVIKKIRSEYDMKKKYLLFMPQIKIEVDGKMQSFDPLGEGIFINQTRYDLRANMLSQLSEEETSDNIELAILPNEDGGKLSMMHDSDRRMLGSIDSKSEIARKRMCCGIAKAGVPSYNDTLIQMFGRVKDAESDVNIDYPSHDITQLQLLITSSCTTGADFMGVSEVYFVGTPASSTEFQQNMYRAIRMCSHALPHLKEGVRVYGVGFSESHEVCQEAKVDDSLREIMGRCIDSEIDKKSDKIVSRYTLETDTPTTFGKSLRSYERFNKVHDKKIIALQERRILQIRGDAIKYAPQFVMDSEEDVEHFTKYTIIPSPSVVSFVKRYEEAADPIARMTCMLEYYYRDSTSFEEMEVEYVTEGQTYNIQPDEALDLNALRDKMTLFHKYLDGKDDELKSIRNDQQLYTITDVLLETQEFLEGMASVEVQGDDWKELHYLDVHRLIDSIRFRVSKLIRGRYAHLIESDGKQHKMAVYGAVMTEGAYMNNETFTERSAVDEKGKAIDKEYASALSESGSMNMYLYMAKKIFRLLTKARSRVLKARNVTQTVPDSWNYSVLFDLQVLEAFCVKHESIADYLLRISIFTPKVGCSDDFRDKILADRYARHIRGREGVVDDKRARSTLQAKPMPFMNVGLCKLPSE